ncbi:MAG: hypothetical protein HGA45_22785 [Chloroflexales bacterium]|nr:hypothetical protein [Chloroflexales bacterium]
MIGICEMVLLIPTLLAGHLWATVIVAAALLVPLVSQTRLYREPTHKNFFRYIVASSPFMVVIQFISAFIVGGYFG